MCTPGITSDCYEGPAGTKDTGICKGGTHTCLADGTFDACVGQVLPGSEDCNTPADEDCDGATPACPSAWTVVIGDNATTQLNLTLLALAPNGDVVVAGAFAGDITLGGSTYHASQFYDVFVTRLTSNGDVLWFRQLPGLAVQQILGVAVGPTDEIAVVGATQGAVDLGAGSQPVSGAGDGFVWKLNANGTPAWGRLIGGPDPNTSEYARAVAIDASGNVGVAGFTRGFSAIGTIELPGNPGTYYYAVLQPNGTPKWAFEYVGDNPHAVAFDAANNFYIAGGDSIIDFGGGAAVANVYAARFSTAGAVQSSKIYWNSNAVGSPFSGMYAPQANGHNVSLITVANPNFDFGGGPVGQFFFALVGHDVQMQHEFTRGFMSGGATTTPYSIIGTRPMAGTVLAGTLTGTAMVETSAGTIDAGATQNATYFARVSGAGVITDGTTFPIAAGCSLAPEAVAADAGDRVYVAGVYNGTSCGGLGSGALPVSNGLAFVSRLGW